MVTFSGHANSTGHVLVTQLVWKESSIILVDGAKFTSPVDHPFHCRTSDLGRVCYRVHFSRHRLELFWWLFRKFGVQCSLGSLLQSTSDLSCCAITELFLGKSKSNSARRLAQSEERAKCARIPRPVNHPQLLHPTTASALASLLRTDQLSEVVQ